MINEIPESRTVRMTIRYINGESDCFEFDSPQEEKALLASHIQRVLNSKELMLEIGDRLLVIPMQNVQKIELSPVPLKLPDIAIRNVRAC
ncbi:putative bifunctional phosphoribosyl-AMP cyclohydrolase/phosphoribosyl-ATP pyrophosphatase protein [Lyngbya aestuarii BL J]|uniref:Putative bifunctional phosphoribosyl-AMP cyclohydrolase/phosphoribosyl-ATP pyrophosphatase protein n=1 Tax=Lyngbya aestuarii BL J TaxID=1348334 RepID=U7QBG4_9CYAN|nr:hypothetical protein [Lyngbya aestuarii]ERT04527.1 putative bifunctional phosphoribosyl-AMP cyclohydrolase/phosphoribosyl-ATP pyrophosphatase protein [Lyngbya aestuarii BL J]